jgi:Family of unknown function (DUF5343)
MPLADSYVQTYGQLPEVFKRLSDGQAPEKFSRQHLKDLGFTSQNFHAVIPLLKSLGFLTADGTPTQRYHDYRDHSQSRAVLGQAMKEAYADLFTIKSNPSPGDRQLIEGKFKSAHNTSERVAQLMASTFYSLLSIADVSTNTPKSPAVAPAPAPTPVPTAEAPPAPVATITAKEPHSGASHRPTLHYNIQIHLPATKDIEVFNAIFRSLKEHLLD